jgi:hypothetical protein
MYELLLWCLVLQLDAGTNVTSVAEILVWCKRGRSRVSLSEMWNDLNHLPIIRKYISAVTDLDALQAMAAKAFDTLPYEKSWKPLQVLLSRCKLPRSSNNYGKVCSLCKLWVPDICAGRAWGRIQDAASFLQGSGAEWGEPGQGETHRSGESNCLSVTS